MPASSFCCRERTNSGRSTWNKIRYVHTTQALDIRTYILYPSVDFAETSPAAQDGDTAAYCLTLPGRTLYLTPLLAQKKFRKKGNKDGAVRAFYQLQEEGLGKVLEVGGNKGTSSVSPHDSVQSCNISSIPLENYLNIYYSDERILAGASDQGNTQINSIILTYIYYTCVQNRYIHVKFFLPL